MTRFSQITRIGTILMFLVVLSVGVVFGQQVTGTLSGRVTDSTGAVVAGATIQIQNPATSFSRTDQADAEGRYVESDLPSGTYSVTVTKTGFQTLVRSGIQVTVGSQNTINAELVVGDVQQHVEVTGEAPAVETSNATISGLVSQDQLRDLPLNGRSIDSLALLTPGIFANRTTSANATVGLGLHLTVNGARQDWNLYLLDGTTTNDMQSGRSSAAGEQLGVEGILEFRIVTHGASAEYGQYSGGVISAVTRSGTNQFHGSVYEFWRNDKLNAVNFFATTTPEFRRNQFGAAVGGPIKKDKLFFFINYEGLRQRQGSPIVATAPINGLRTAGTYVIGGTTYIVDPSIVPYVNLYPPFNSTYVQSNLSSSVTPPAAGDATELVTTNVNQPTREDYAMGRLDWKISDKDSAFARYVFDPSKFTFSNATPDWANTITGTDRFVAVGETHIFSASSLNEFRFAFNRTRPTQNSGTAPWATIVKGSGLYFNPLALSIGSISFSATTAGAASVSALGGNNSSPQAFVKNLIQESDTFTKTAGAHTIKFGVDVEREQLNVFSCSACNGKYSFNTFSDFLQGIPKQFTVLVQDPAINSSAYKEYRRTLFGSFVQDDWRIRPNLTLNLGLRWEFMTNPSEANGQIAGVPNLGFAGAQNVLGPAFITPKANFSPRVGLAWDPTGSGKTSIRASGGIYDNQLNDRSWFSTAQGNSLFELSISPTPTSSACASIFNGVGGESGKITPNVPVAALLNPLGCNAGFGSQDNTNIEYFSKEPVVYQWNLEVQRQLVNTLSLRVGYVGSRGTHLPAPVEMNPIKPTSFDAATGLPVFPTAKGSPTINTAFGSMQSTMTSGVSSYNALQVVLQKTTSMGLSFQASYSYSRALSNMDQVTTGQVSTAPATYMNMFNGNQDYSLAGFDQRHTLVVNGAYQMPFEKWVTSAVAKKFVGGWSINGIYSYGTGLPLTALDGGNNSNSGDTNNTDRPNLNPGFSTNPNSGISAGCTAAGGPAPGTPLHTPAHWFDPCAFSASGQGTQVGQFGNLGRNTIIGPGTSNMDFTIVKLTPITESVKVEFRGEVFNMLNHPMFGLVNNAVFTGKNSLTYSSSAGRITSTSIDNRELQLGLKLIF